MKRFLKLMLVSVFALSLAACGSSSTGDTEGSGDGKSYTIGLAIYKYDDSFMTTYRNTLADLFEKQGKEDGNTYTINAMDGKNDQAEQMNQIDTFISQDVDLIIANLVDPVNSELVIQKAAAANIPVIFINREPEQTVFDNVAKDDATKALDGKVTYVGSKATQSGEFQGEIINDLENKGDFDGDGTLRYAMIMGDPQNVDAQQRTEGSIAKYTELSDIPVEKLFQERGDWDRSKGQELAANALTKFGAQLDVIFCNNDDMALGALQAIEAAGRTVGTDIAIVGVDALPEAVEAVKSGKMSGTVKNDAEGQASQVVKVALDLFADKTVEDHYWVPYVKITKDTAE